MTPQLRTAVAAATREHVETARRLLMEAGELHHADEDPRGVLFAALSLSLAESADSGDLPCPRLRAAVAAVPWGAVQAVVVELAQPSGTPGWDALCQALMRELATAASTRGDELAAARSELDATVGVPEGWA